MISRVRMRTAPVRIARDGPWRITALTSGISYDEFVRTWRFAAPGKRIYDGSNPLKAAGISNPTAPDSAAPQPSAAGLTSWPGLRPESPRVPWPGPVNLYFQGEAQHDPDQHDQSQNPDALKGLIHQDRADNVCDDQHLETEQDHASEIGSQLPERIGRVGSSLLPIATEGDEPSEDHNHGTGALDNFHHLAGDTLVAHRPTLAKAVIGGQTKAASLPDGLTASLG